MAKARKTAKAAEAKPETGRRLARIVQNRRDGRELYSVGERVMLEPDVFSRLVADGIAVADDAEAAGAA